MLIHLHYHLKVLLGCLSLTIPVFLDGLLASALVGDELLNFLAVHVLGHVVGLPFLEAEPETFICNPESVTVTATRAFGGESVRE